MIILYQGDFKEHIQKWVRTSKELSVVIHTVRHNYIISYCYNEGSNNNMFRPYMWGHLQVVK